MTPASVLRAVTAPIQAVIDPFTKGKASQTPTPQWSGAPSAAQAASPAAASSASPASQSASSFGVPTNAGATINNAQQSLANDQTTFFKLLTAQLRNQDPLSPLDANQFTQQLVAMTGVQQQILTNQLLNQMVSGQGGVGSSVGLIGKTVTAATSASTLQGGKADWTYKLDAAAKDVTIQVVDAQGNVVYQTTQSNLAAGDNSFQWDGKDLTGVQRADGKVFGLRVTAKDASGGNVGTYVFLRGDARSIEMINGETVVDVNGTKVPLNLITGVSANA